MRVYGLIGINVLALKEHEGCSGTQYEYVDCTYNIFILHAKHPKPIGKAPPFLSPYHVIVILLLRN